MRPAITALLPIKNGALWIPRIVSNLRACLEPSDQLIIVDDHSTDDSWSILSKLDFNFEFTLFSNQGHGLVAALNQGIRLAKHPWIARFDVDDEYPRERLELQLSKVEDSTVAIFGDYSFVNDSGENLGLMPSPIFPLSTALSLVHSDRTAHPSAVFRKSAAIEVGLYREKDFPSEDISLWIRLLHVGDLTTVPHPVLKYTLHKNSVSSSRYYEAKARSEELINSMLDFNRLVLNVEKEFTNYIKAYSNINLGRERKILFLRDLLSKVIFSRFTLLFKVRLISYGLFQLLFPFTLLYLTKLYIHQKRRQKTRFN